MVSLDYLAWFIQQLGHANKHGALVENAADCAGRILGDGLSTWVDLRTTELVYLRDEVGMLRYHARGFMRFMEEASYVDPTAGDDEPEVSINGVDVDLLAAGGVVPMVAETAEALQQMQEEQTALQEQESALEDAAAELEAQAETVLQEDSEQSEVGFEADEAEDSQRTVTDEDSQATTLASALQSTVQGQAHSGSSTGCS